MRFRITTKSTNNSISDLSIMLLCILIAVFEIPIIYRTFPTVVNIGSIVLMLGFIVLNLNSYINLRGYYYNTLVLLVVCILYELFYRIMGISSAGFYYSFITLKFFFFFLVLIGPLKSINIKQTKWILNLSIFFLFFTLATNVYLYYQYGAYRYVYLYQSEVVKTVITNAVGTQFVASLLFLTGTLFAFFMDEKRKRNNILVLFISLVPMFFSIIIAQRGIMLFLFFVMFFLFFLFRSKKKKEKYIWGIFILIIIVLLILNATTLLNWISQILPSERISNRINQVLVFLSTQDISESGGSLSARYKLINVSIESFLSSIYSFLFGMGDHQSDNLIIGNHSQFFDEFARYGIIGAFLKFWLIIRSLKIVKIRSCIKENTRSYRYLNIILFMVLLRSLFGGIINELMGLQIFVMLPMLFKYMDISNYDKCDLKNQA